jgi:hypothetical protein
VPQSFAQMTLLSSKIEHFYTNRNYFNDAKTHIEPYFLNEWLYMSDFSVNFIFFYNVLDMKKVLSTSAPPPPTYEKRVFFHISLFFFALTLGVKMFEISKKITLLSDFTCVFIFYQR